jgi:hypothetical protein
MLSPTVPLLGRKIRGISITDHVAAQARRAKNAKALGKLGKSKTGLEYRTYKVYP